MKERYAEGEIPHKTKTGGGPILQASMLKILYVTLTLWQFDGCNTRTSKTMTINTMLFAVAVAAAVGISALNPSSNVVNAGSTCSAQAQTNEKSGQHTVGPITASSSGGSCSISVSSRAGQGSPHIRGSDAFNDPGFRTGTCTSSSAGPSGITSDFNDGQSSSDRSCSIHSP